jgi:hypothetical protein
MTPQVDFLGVLFIVWGLLTTLVGVSTLALGIGAFAIIRSAGHGNASSQFAAGLTAVLFTTLAILAILWGTAHITVGIPLRRHRSWARVMALLLASVDLLLLPYGTALGIYTLWLLLSEKGKGLFEEHSRQDSGLTSA